MAVTYRQSERDLVLRLVQTMGAAWRTLPASEEEAVRQWRREFVRQRPAMQEVVAELVSRGLSYYGESDAVRTLRWVGDRWLEKWGLTVVERVTIPLARKHDLGFAWSRLPTHFERVVQPMARAILSWGALFRAAGVHDVPWDPRLGQRPMPRLPEPSPLYRERQEVPRRPWWNRVFDKLLRRAGAQDNDVLGGQTS